VIAVALALWADPAAAQETEQYRSFKLSDGREFTAIILATEAAGFQVRVPQGEMQVPFAQLFDMIPVTKAEYDSQDDWVVYLAVPPERQKGLASSFEVIPHVNVYGGPQAPSGTRITSDMEAKALACDLDVACIATALTGAPWVWIVTARQEASDLVFAAQTNQGTPRQNPVRAGMFNSDQVANAPWNVLELTPVAGETIGPTVVGNTDLIEKRAKAIKASFIPVPGMSALANKDMGGFGLAMATTIPATALWVGMVGKNTQSGAGLAAMSLGGYYAITVAVNQAVGLRGLKKPTAGGAAVGLAPTEGGGAMITLVASH
jgi:hypothetical protein